MAALWFRAYCRATAVIADRSWASRNEMEPAEVEDYLRQLGLERLIEVRARRGEGM